MHMINSGFAHERSEFPEGQNNNSDSGATGTPAGSFPSSRSSSPCGRDGHSWGVGGEMASYVKIEGIDYAFEDGTMYDSVAKGCLMFF